MRKPSLLIALVTSLIHFSALSQDLIVTTKNDSIKCDIKEVKFDHFYFTHMVKGVERDSTLVADSISFYEYKYFDQLAKQKAHRQKGKFSSRYSRYRIAFDGGFSYRTVKTADGIPDDFENYIQELKSGYHVGGQLSYFITPQLGIGLRGSIYRSTNSIDDVYIQDPQGNRLYGKMSDDIKVYYIGPSVTGKLKSRGSVNAFVASFSIGYMGYKNDAVLITPLEMTGATIGVTYDIGYDIKIDPNLMLGIQASATIGNLFQYDLTYGTITETIELEEEYEGLTRIDLSVGIRFVD